MQDSDIIDALGGTGKVAAILGVEAPSVSDWRKKGVPKARRHTLALLFPDVVPKEWLPPGQQQALKSNARPNHVA